MEDGNVDEKRRERNLLNHIFLKAFIVIAFTVVYLITLAKRLGDWCSLALSNFDVSEA